MRGADPEPIPADDLGHGRAVAVLVMAMVSLQAGSSFAKSLFPAVGAIGAVTLRLTFATIALWSLLRPWRRWPPRELWTPLLVYGAAIAGMNLGLYSALRTLPLGLALALEFLGPLTVALLASRRARDFLWIGVAALGLAFLLPWAGARIDPFGGACALFAAACWGLYIWHGRKLGGAYGGSAVAIGIAIAACLAAPIGAALHGAALLQPRVLASGAWLALLATAIPYLLEMRAMARLPAKTFGVLMSLEPAVAATMGFAVLGERLTARQVAAIAAVIVASAGMTMMRPSDNVAGQRGASGQV